MENDNKCSDDEIFYKLLKPFDYSFKGEVRSAEFVTLKAPAVNNIASIAKLKQGFMRAIISDKNTEGNKNSGTDNKDDDLDIFTGQMIIAALSISNVDYAEYLETAKTVFTNSNICLIDGEIQFNNELTKKLSFDDLEGMTGEYLRVFILSSVLRMMQT